MRIIGGQWRGRSLEAPKDNTIRPTTDRTREVIFNVLQHRYDLPEDATVLDAFCGSGALGLEALSRGARQSVLVDMQPTLAKENSTRLDAENAQVYRRDILKLSTEMAFDLVFLDPPYDKPGLAEKTIRHLITTGQCTETTLIVYEMAVETETPVWMMVKNEKTIARSRVAFGYPLV